LEFRKEESANITQVAEYNQHIVGDLMTRIQGLDKEVKNLNMLIKNAEKRTKEEKFLLREGLMEDTKKIASEYKSYRNLADLELRMNDQTISKAEKAIF